MSRSLLRPHLSRLRPLALGLVLVTGGVLATATPSSAHDRLVSSDPADGVSLPSVPERVTLTYNNEVLEVGSEIALSTAAGAPVTTDPATVEGRTVSVPWPSSQGAGEYTVVWRVVSSDGHPIDGTLSFSVAGTASSSAPTTSAPTTGTSTPSVTSAAPGATPGSTPAAAESATTDGSGPSGLLIGGIVVLVLLAVVGAVAVVRRRSS